MKIFLKMVAGLYITAVFYSASLYAADKRASVEEGLEFLLFEEIPIVTTAALFEQKLTDAPSAMTVITAEDIKKKGYTKLTEVLIDIPGIVDMSDVNEDIVGIRGGYASTSNTYLTLVNGHRMNVSPVANFNPDQYIGLDKVEKIEVILGPGSALYGTGAMLGVVNIITKKGFDGVYTKAKGGPFGTELEASVGKIFDKDNNVFFDFTYWDEKGDEIDQPASLDMAPAGMSKKAGKVYWNKHPDNYQAFGSYTGLNMKIDMNFEHLVRVMPRGSNGNLYDYEAEKVKRRFIADTFYIDGSNTWHFSDTSKLTFNPSYSFFQQRGIHAFTYASDDMPTLGTGTSWVSDVNQAQGRLIYENQLMENFKFTVGLDDLYLMYHPMDAISNFATNNGFEYKVNGSGKEGNWNIAGIFGQMVWTPVSKVDLVLGARYDTFAGKVDPEVTPRASFIYRIIDPLTFKLCYSKAYLSPQWTHLTATSVGGYLGNPDLEPQRVESIDAILDMTLKNFQGSLKLFKTKTDGIINSIVINSVSGLRQYQNTGIGDYQGAEIQGRYKLTDYLRLDASYSYIDDAGDTSAIYLTEGELSFIPKSVIRYGIGVLPLNNLSVELWGRTYSDVKSPDNITGNTTIEGWSTLDFSIGYAISGFDIALYLNNLTDKEYTIGGTTGSRPIPRSGFGWDLSVGYKF